MSGVNARRLFLQKCFSSVVQTTFIAFVIESCRSKTTGKGNGNKAVTVSDPCSDYSDLSKDNIKKRESLGYVQKSPSANKQCGNCNLWLPPVAGQLCGKC